MSTKIFALFTCVSILFSCSPVAIKQVPGKYLASNNESKTSIVLMGDGKFTFTQNNLGVIRTCTGIWEMESDRKLNLKCDNQSADLEKVLSSGYMGSLGDDLFLKGKRKIKIGNLVLVKQKEK